MQCLEASLRDGLQKSAQINSILANLPDGLCIYDSAKRVVLCNERYARLYDLSPENVKPGMSSQEVAKRRAAKGFFVTERLQEYKNGQMASGPTRKQRIDVLSDGRAILISTQRMPDQGWIALHQDISEIRRNEARIAFLAHHDALTGLANRTRFKERIEKACAQLVLEGKPFSIMMLDLDRFKKINDSFGHAAGDDLLKQVAIRLQATIRECDVLARLGGDEFAVVQTAPRLRDGRADVVSDHRDGAIVLANRIIEVLNDPFELNGSKAFIGTSIGISLAPTDGTDPDDLLKKADLALYDAKENGRNAYRFFNAEILEVADRRHRLEADMRVALDRGEFELHYQPIIDIRTGKLTGAEALVRWRHPERGLLPPDHFIPLAEETGFMIPLGEWILYQACQDAAEWSGNLKLAVNLSAVQLRKCDVLDVIICALADSGLPPERLEVEVTETVLLELTDYLTLLHQLKNIIDCAR